MQAMQTRIPFQTSALRAAVDAVNKIIPNKPSNPIFAYLQVRLEHDTLLVGGTDGSQTVTYRLPANTPMGLETLRFLVPAGTIQELLRHAPAEVSLEFPSSADSRLRLHFGPGSAAQVNTVSPDGIEDVFAAPEGEWRTALLPAKELERGLGVAYAASGEEYRAVLRAILVDAPKGRFVASDGFRLCMAEVGGISDLPNPLLPRKAVQYIAANLPQTGDVTLAVDGPATRARLELGPLTYTFALHEGEYLEYARVIPQSFAAKFYADPALVRSALLRMLTFTGRTKHKRVDFTLSESALFLSAEGDSGRAREGVPVRDVTGQTPLNLSYNGGILLDALTHLDPLEGGLALFRLSGTTSPTLLEGQQTKALVVPLRI